jgi:hypothetical protein
MSKDQAIKQINRFVGEQNLNSSNTHWSNLVNYRSENGWWLNIPFSKFTQDLNFILNNVENHTLIHIEIPAYSINNAESIFRNKQGKADIFIPQDDIKSLIDTQSGSARHNFSKYPVNEYKYLLDAIELVSGHQVNPSIRNPKTIENNSHKDKFVMDNEHIKELLIKHRSILAELKSLGVCLTGNNPLGDFAEWIACQKFELERMPNSTKGYDAVCKDTGVRYQIKSRTYEASHKSYPLGAIRNLESKLFDYLIVVLVKPTFDVEYTLVIPHKDIKSLGKYREHTNAHIITLNQRMIDEYKLESDYH